jgi:hypothetical protein
MGIAGTPAPAVADGPSSRRRFSLLFFDPVLVALDPPPDLDHETWTASATVVGESALLAAHSGARRTRVHGSVP